MLEQGAGRFDRKTSRNAGQSGRGDADALSKGGAGLQPETAGR